MEWSVAMCRTREGLERSHSGSRPTRLSAGDGQNTPERGGFPHSAAKRRGCGRTDADPFCRSSERVPQGPMPVSTQEFQGEPVDRGQDTQESSGIARWVGCCWERPTTSWTGEFHLVDVT